MKGMIFAAGLGTRLRPLTDHTPKALIEVGGKSMLERVIEKMIRVGIKEIVVNVHHHAGKVKEFLTSLHLPSEVRVAISDETDLLLDTGGGIAKAVPLLGLDDDILLHNADIYTDFSLEEMISQHRVMKSDATLLVAHRRTSRYLLFDVSGRMVGWENTTSGEILTPFQPEALGGCERLGFGGVHIISPKVLESIESYRPPGEKFSITPFYIENCDKLDIRAFLPEGEYNWIDIGRLESLIKARKIVEHS